MRIFLSRSVRKSINLTLHRSFSDAKISVNGINYSYPPINRPVVAICLDGSSQDYIDRAIEAGCMPNWTHILERKENKGQSSLVCSVVPTFTNPNNVGIVTGSLPKVHGITGNYFYDEVEGVEVPMNDPKHMRCDTILAKLSEQGVQVTVLTAKDKLLCMLSKGLVSDHSLSMSVEYGGSKDSILQLAKQGTSLQDLMGTTTPPSIYSGDISIFLLQMGVKLLRHNKARENLRSVYYLSTTDYIQHKFAPGSDGANSFYNAVDGVIGDLDREGALVGLTADHGMNNKTRYNGDAKVVYAQQILNEANIPSRVILPITDPYVVHHGSLGSYATVYIHDKTQISQALSLLRQQPGIYTVMNKEDACRAMDLPPDRVGDIIMLGDENTTIGISEAHHDLSQVKNLRSHGGLEEQIVPMFINAPLAPSYAKTVGRGKKRNYHLFDVLLNGIQHKN